MQSQMSPAPIFPDGPSKPQDGVKRIARGNGGDELTDCGSTRTIASIHVCLPNDGKIDPDTLDLLSEAMKQPIIHEENNNVKSVYLCGVQEEISALKFVVGETPAPTRPERQIVPQAMLDASKEAKLINKEKNESLTSQEYRDRADQRAHEREMLKMQLERARIQAGQGSTMPVSNGPIPSIAQQRGSVQQARTHGANKHPWESDLDEDSDC